MAKHLETEIDVRMRDLPGSAVGTQGEEEMKESLKRVHGGSQRTRREFIVTSAGAVLSPGLGNLLAVTSTSQSPGITVGIFRSRDLLTFELSSTGLRFRSHIFKNVLSVEPVNPGS